MSINLNVASVAALISDPSRVAILTTLLDGRLHPASELAMRAKIKPQTASFHLAKLMEMNLIQVEKQGRHRYYQLSDCQVAEVLENLLALSPPSPVTSLKQSNEMNQITFARTCYDHLAGHLGVSLTDALIEMNIVEPTDNEYLLTHSGEKFLIDFGMDVEQIRTQRRAFSRRCLDWSERKYHLAGGLGNAVMLRLMELNWIARNSNSRAVTVTEEGITGFKEVFSITLKNPHDK